MYMIKDVLNVPTIIFRKNQSYGLLPLHASIYTVGTESIQTPLNF